MYLNDRLEHLERLNAVFATIISIRLMHKVHGVFEVTHALPPLTTKPLGALDFHVIIIERRIARQQDVRHLIVGSVGLFLL